MRKLIVSLVAFVWSCALAQAATATFNDMQILQGDPVFQSRSLASLVQYCESTVLNEAVTASTLGAHVSRKAYCVNVLGSPPNFKTQASYIAAMNQTCANDTTAGGTLVGQTGAQIATAALLCVDTDMANAISAAFDGLVPGL